MKSSSPQNARRQSRRRGATIVEAALVLTTTLILIIAILELGMYVMIFQGVSNRAREGARYAAIHPDEPDAAKNVVLYGNPLGGASPLFGLAPGNVELTSTALDNESEVRAVSVQVSLLTGLTAFVTEAPFQITVRVATPVEGIANAP